MVLTCNIAQVKKIIIVFIFSKNVQVFVILMYLGILIIIIGCFYIMIYFP